MQNNKPLLLYAFDVDNNGNTYILSEDPEDGIQYLCIYNDKNEEIKRIPLGEGGIPPRERTLAVTSTGTVFLPQASGSKLSVMKLSGKFSLITEFTTDLESDIEKVYATTDYRDRLYLLVKHSGVDDRPTYTLIISHNCYLLNVTFVTGFEIIDFYLCDKGVVILCRDERWCLRMIFDKHGNIVDSNQVPSEEIFRVFTFIDDVLECYGLDINDVDKIVLESYLLPKLYKTGVAIVRSRNVKDINWLCAGNLIMRTTIQSRHKDDWLKITKRQFVAKIGGFVFNIGTIYFGNEKKQVVFNNYDFPCFFVRSGATVTTHIVR